MPAYYTAPAPLSAYSWTGPYLGGNLGYQWGTTSNNPTARPASPAESRAATTGRPASSCSAARPTSQSPGADDTFAPWKFSNPWFGTLRGRAG